MEGTISYSHVANEDVDCDLLWVALLSEARNSGVLSCERSCVRGPTSWCATSIASNVVHRLSDVGWNLSRNDEYRVFESSQEVLIVLALELVPEACRFESQWSFVQGPVVWA